MLIGFKMALRTASFRILKINQTSISKKSEKIIFLLPTYGGVINKKETLEKSWKKIKQKDVYLVVVGAVPQESSWSQKSYKTIKKEVRDGLKGYVKIICLANDIDRKPSKIENFFVKLFLKIDPDKLDKRTEVFKEDLNPVWKMNIWRKQQRKNTSIIFLWVGKY